MKLGPRRRHQRPYDPVTQGPQARLDEAQRSRVHDRRAREINRGTVAHIVEAEVDDPYEPGARISAVRSVRDDPLAWHLARNHIDQAQFEAGRAFQRWFAVAERGPRALQIAEAVDGDPPRETLTDEQLRAGKWLARCHRVLGRDGSILVHEVLIRNMTSRQIAESRGMANADWQRYVARRFYECLDTLAVVFGFANGTSP